MTGAHFDLLQAINNDDRAAMRKELYNLTGGVGLAGKPTNTNTVQVANDQKVEKETLLEMKKANTILGRIATESKTTFAPNGDRVEKTGTTTKIIRRYEIS
jgi:hypothetical protein